MKHANRRILLSQMRRLAFDATAVLLKVYWNKQLTVINDWMTFIRYSCLLKTVDRCCVRKKWSCWYVAIRRWTSTNCVVSLSTTDTRPTTIPSSSYRFVTVTDNTHVALLTGCTVVLTCCKGECQSQWKTPTLAPRSSETPSSISIKFETDDYIGNATPHANFFLYVRRGRVPV